VAANETPIAEVTLMTPEVSAPTEEQTQQTAKKSTSEEVQTVEGHAIPTTKRPMWRVIQTVVMPPKPH